MTENIGTNASRRPRRWISRLKRSTLEVMARDQRFRRSALNHLFSKYLADGVLCLVTFDDHQLFVNPRDDKISFTLMSGRPWQRRDLEAAFDVIRQVGRLGQNSVFVDVGANIGAITIYASLSGLFRHIIAVEPDALNRSILERNIAVNGLSDSVSVVPVAASSSSGEMTLHRDEKNLGAHSLEPGFAKTPGSKETVAVKTLDQIVEGAGFEPRDIGFVKIDVEGHEGDVLKGMSSVLANGPPILMETTFDLTAGAKVLGLLPAAYTTCADVALRDATTDLPVPAKLTAFVPSSLQHDLVVY